MSMDPNRDELLEHEFDGIREFDNRPPGWIMWILWGSIVYAVGYWSFVHTYGWGRLPAQQYAVSMAKAAERQLAAMEGKEVTDESLLLMTQIPTRVADGKQIFEQLCSPCHLNDGSGKVGPNLTDAFWVHGGRPTQILKTVTYGVPEKGMVAWMDQLGPDRVQKVVTYLLTMKNRNLPGKEPQGDPETAAGEATPSPPSPSPPPSSAAPSAPVGGNTH